LIPLEAPELCGRACGLSPQKEMIIRPHSHQFDTPYQRRDCIRGSTGLFRTGGWVGIFVVLFLMIFSASATSVFAGTGGPVAVPCIPSDPIFCGRFCKPRSTAWVLVHHVSRYLPCFVIVDAQDQPLLVEHKDEHYHPLPCDCVG
jgi:hypothetical protein